MRIAAGKAGLCRAYRISQLWNHGCRIGTGAPYPVAHPMQAGALVQETPATRANGQRSAVAPTRQEYDSAADRPGNIRTGTPFRRPDPDRCFDARPPRRGSVASSAVEGSRKGEVRALKVAVKIALLEEMRAPDTRRRGASVAAAMPNHARRASERMNRQPRAGHPGHAIAISRFADRRRKCQRCDKLFRARPRHRRHSRFRRMTFAPALCNGIRAETWLQLRHPPARMSAPIRRSFCKTSGPKSACHDHRRRTSRRFHDGLIFHRKMFVGQRQRKPSKMGHDQRRQSGRVLRRALQIKSTRLLAIAYGGFSRWIMPLLLSPGRGADAHHRLRQDL